MGRNQGVVEDNRSHAVKAPPRVATRNGTTVITINDDTQQRTGIKTDMLVTAAHQEEIRAYGMVLDVARLTKVSNDYNRANAEVRTAQVKLSLSRATCLVAANAHGYGSGIHGAGCTVAGEFIPELKEGHCGSQTLVMINQFSLDCAAVPHVV